MYYFALPRRKRKQGNNMLMMVICFICVATRDDVVAVREAHATLPEPEAPREDPRRRNRHVCALFGSLSTELSRCLTSCSPSCRILPCILIIFLTLLCAISVPSLRTLTCHNASAKDSADAASRLATAAPMAANLPDTLHIIAPCPSGRHTSITECEILLPRGGREEEEGRGHS